MRKSCSMARSMTVRMMSVSSPARRSLVCKAEDGPYGLYRSHQPHHRSHPPFAAVLHPPRPVLLGSQGSA
jgi:hypothetical protein